MDTCRQLDVHPFAAQFIEVTYHHDAIEHSHTKERDEANAGTDAHVEVADKEREDAADEREGNVQDDEQRLFHRVERAEQQQLTDPVRFFSLEHHRFSNRSALAMTTSVAPVSARIASQRLVWPDSANTRKMAFTISAKAMFP